MLKITLSFQSRSELFGLVKWVHLTFNTWAGSLQWVAHTSLDIPLPNILPVVSGPGPPLSTDHRRSTLRINRLHAAGKRQENFGFPDFYAHTGAFPVASPLKLFFP